ncbi:MAG: hypothetical protein IH878_20750 [Gemmatimonadetes bacterium]|nr:hypothetical protein [Gemmatimonadota bacterium]MCH7778937.1 hypothetical protein [Gemmatimonadota bacterium]
MYEVGQVLELTGDQTRGVVEYLVNEDLLEFRRYRYRNFNRPSYKVELPEWTVHPLLPV